MYSVIICVYHSVKTYNTAYAFVCESRLQCMCACAKVYDGVRVRVCVYARRRIDIGDLFSPKDFGQDGAKYLPFIISAVACNRRKL